MLSTQTSMNLYRTPFTPGYWREAAASANNLRNLVFAALMVAACILLSGYSIPVTVGVKITFGFLARSVCALVYGPVGVILFGAVEDTLGFVMSGKGQAYFPGYMLTTILGCLIYALLFYRARITITRIFMAKLLTNIMNVFLGSLWSAILLSKGYLYYMTTSAWKNSIMLIPQTLMLVLLFQALLPILQKMGLIPKQLEGRMPLF